jgi:tetratricopeptide (TPR) repeat protein
MIEIEGPDKWRRNAAEGWIELGNHLEAARELENVSPQLRDHPDILVLRVRISLAARNWEEAAQIAHTLTQVAPEMFFGWIHRGYALHEMKRTREACDLLLSVVENFPDWLIRYNLACYACQLGMLKEALEWLEKARNLAQSNEVNLMALEDPDLKPIWKDISRTLTS